MANEKSGQSFKIFVTDNSQVLLPIIIPVAAGIITLFLNLSKMLYMQQYFGYFEIDMKYVSIDYIWDISNIAIDYCRNFFNVLNIIIDTCLILNIVKVIKRYYSERKKNTFCYTLNKYLRKELIQSIIVDSFLMIYTTFMIEFFYILLTQDIFNPEIENFDSFTVHGFATDFMFWLFFKLIVSTYVAGFYYVFQKERSDFSTIKRKDRVEILYERIFQKGSYSESFKRQQMEILKEYYPKKQQSSFSKGIIAFSVTSFIIICVFSYYIQTGRLSAYNQKEFLVTEDNKHVAIPVSMDRYAVINAEIRGEDLSLVMGGQDFQSVLDYPCQKRTFQTVKKIDK